MSSLQQIYPDNDNLIWLRSATRARAGTVISTGTATLTTMTDSAGAVVTGVTFPLTMVVDDPVAGDWVTQLDDAAVLVAGQIYDIVIDIDDGTGTVGRFEPRVLAVTRSTM